MKATTLAAAVIIAACMATESRADDLAEFGAYAKQQPERQAGPFTPQVLIVDPEYTYNGPPPTKIPQPGGGFIWVPDPFSLQMTLDPVIENRTWLFYSGPNGNISVPEPAWWPPQWWTEIAYFPGATLPRIIGPFNPAPVRSGFDLPWPRQRAR